MSVTESVNPANYIATFTGAVINPLDPDPAAINPEDIAHALANQCRFTGHVREFYSVAQHSVLVADLVRDRHGVEYAWEGLLHDASEAYISDLARPVKRNPDIAAFYDAAETRLMEVIAKKFGFDWPMSPEVKWADDVLLRTEQRDLMPDAYLGDYRLRVPGEEYLAMPITPWMPKEAESAWLEFYEAYQL